MHIEFEVQKYAEVILSKVGISMSNEQQGLSFEVSLLEAMPISCKPLTNEQFEDEVKAGLAEVASGKLIPSDNVESEMIRAFGICIE